MLQMWLAKTGDIGVGWAPIQCDWYPYKKTVTWGLRHTEWTPLMRQAKIGRMQPQARECWRWPGSHQQLEEARKDPPLCFREAWALLIPWFQIHSLQTWGITFVFQITHLLIYFFITPGLVEACRIFYLWHVGSSSLPRDGTWAPCIASMEF